MADVLPECTVCASWEAGRCLPDDSTSPPKRHCLSAAQMLPQRAHAAEIWGVSLLALPSGFLSKNLRMQGKNPHKVEYLARIFNAADADLYQKYRRISQ